MLRSRARSGAPGTTLVELLVALVIVGVLTAAATRLTLSSARWAEGEVLRAERGMQLDAGRGVLHAILAPTAPRRGDITLATDTAATVWATISRASLCAALPGVAVLPAGPRADALSIGAYVTSPQSGDLLAVFDDGPSPGPSDDRWTTHTVVSARVAAGACAGSPLVDPVADRALPAWVLAVAPTLAPHQAGAPASLLRPQRVALYRSATDWALGMSEQVPGGAWSGIQPFAGPLETPRLRGVHLDWLDSSFASAPSSPTYVRMTLRAPTRRGLRARSGTTPADSQQRLLLLRNHR